MMSGSGIRRYSKVSGESGGKLNTIMQVNANASVLFKSKNYLSSGLSGFAPRTLHYCLVATALPALVH